LRNLWPALERSFLLPSTVSSQLILFTLLVVIVALLFPGIGCAGEIRISRHDDFDKWAIDILVKFRENERLQLLTGQRQSGGVRRCHDSFYSIKLIDCII
jgi:hypothetical protein